MWWWTTSLWIRSWGWSRRRFARKRSAINTDQSGLSVLCFWLLSQALRRAAVSLLLESTTSDRSRRLGVSSDPLRSQGVLEEVDEPLTGDGTIAPL